MKTPNELAKELLDGPLAYFDYIGQVESLTEAIQNDRNAVLEEAAMLADNGRDNFTLQLACDIRRLKQYSSVNAEDTKTATPENTSVSAGDSGEESQNPSNNDVSGRDRLDTAEQDNHDPVGQRVYYRD